MKKNEVPQQKGLFGSYHEVQYALDDNGHYSKIPSAGWDAKGVANSQYWQELEEQVLAVLDEIQAGKASPLKFYMIVNQMDPAMLASYVRLSTWRVKRHLKSHVFAKLDAEIMQRYATVFEVSLDRLQQTPSDLDRWQNIRLWAHRYDGDDHAD